MEHLSWIKEIKCVYCGIAIKQKKICVAFFDKKNINVEFYKSVCDITDEIILQWFEKYATEHNIKIIAIGVEENEKYKALGASFWLELDVVPYFLNLGKRNFKNFAVFSALKISRQFDDNNLVKIKLSKQRQVDVSWLTRLEDYQKITNPKQFTILLNLAKEFKKRTGQIVFINSTPRGGGVALMRHALIRLFRLIGVDARWHVVSGSNDVFAITKKKFHNTFQGINLNLDEITRQESHLYNKWSKLNSKRLMRFIKNADIVVIDDPQPSGLIPYIKRSFPDIKIIYRSHIHIDTNLIAQKNSAQYKNWQFIWNNIKHADLFVSHPVLHFIPNVVKRKKTVLMPAATDLLDGLNKPLSREQISFYIQQFNTILCRNGQKPLNTQRPYIIQIARFDPSKGIIDVLESYLRFRKKLEIKEIPKENIPQLVIVGHKAIDDPESKLIYNEVLSMLKMDYYADFTDDIKVARLYSSDQLLNSLLCASKIALQLSHKEGFEIKITEALNMGIPVIAYKVGGIPLQIRHKINGYLVKVGNTHKVADYMYKLFVDQDCYSKMKKNSKKYVKDFFTVKNAISWLFLANELMKKSSIRGNSMTIEELMQNQKNLKHKT